MEFSTCYIHRNGLIFYKIVPSLIAFGLNIPTFKNNLKRQFSTGVNIRYNYIT